MNYLAHFYLSGDDEQLLSGQFLGDIVKGSNYNHFPPAIRDGILLHRFIDDQTDRHNACREFRAFLRPMMGIHSSITIDMILDHVLATRWNQFSKLPLPEFARRTYESLTRNSAFFPERMLNILKYMQEYDWLTAYASTDGMRRSLRGLARRVSGGQILEKAADNLESLIPSANSCFESFFPDLVAVCTVKINTFAADNQE